MKKFLFFLIPLSCFAEFESTDRDTLSAIGLNVHNIAGDTLNTYNQVQLHLPDIDSNLGYVRSDVHTISTYLDYIKNNLPSSGTTNQFIDYSSYLSSVNPLAGIKYLNTSYSYTDLDPNFTSQFSNYTGDNTSHDFSFLLSEIIRRLGYLQNTTANLDAQRNLIVADTRNVITNNLTYKNTVPLSFQYTFVPMTSDLDSSPFVSNRSVAPSKPYSTAYLLYLILREQGYIGSHQSYYYRDFLLQLQDIRRLLSQYSTGSTNIVNVGITNIVDIAQLDPLWRGLGEEFNIGRLWSEAFITPNKDGNVIQETYLSHYDDLSTHFFEAVPELILMGVRQRKSVNTTLFNVLTNIQIHTTLLRSIDNNVGIIASNFNYQTQVEDSSAEVRGNITEAQSTLRIAWENNELPSELELDWWGRNIKNAELPDDVVLDFSDIVHDISWGFFKFEDVSPNDFVLTANLTPYRTFFSFVRGVFIFFYVCIAVSLVACIFFLCTKLFAFISTIISTNSL